MLASLGLDTTKEMPKGFDPDATYTAVITMGCGEACPFYAGARYEDWELDDPKGQDEADRDDASSPTSTGVSGVCWDNCFRTFNCRPPSSPEARLGRCRSRGPPTLDEWLAAVQHGVCALGPISPQATLPTPGRHVGDTATSERWTTFGDVVPRPTRGAVRLAESWRTDATNMGSHPGIRARRCRRSERRVATATSRRRSLRSSRPSWSLVGAAVGDVPGRLAAVSGAFFTAQNRADTTANGVPAPDTGPVFASQPVQGVSAVIPAGHGQWWALADNGYGTRDTSADWQLAIYRMDLGLGTGHRSARAGDGRAQRPAQVRAVEDGVRSDGGHRPAAVHLQRAARDQARRVRDRPGRAAAHRIRLRPRVDRDRPRRAPSGSATSSARSCCTSTATAGCSRRRSRLLASSRRRTRR